MFGSRYALRRINPDGTDYKTLSSSYFDYYHSCAFDYKTSTAFYAVGFSASKTATISKVSLPGSRGVKGCLWQQCFIGIQLTQL